MNNQKLEALKKEWIETAQDQANNEYNDQEIDMWYENDDFWEWQYAHEQNQMYQDELEMRLDELTDQIKAMVPDFDFNELDAYVIDLSEED